MDDIGANNRTIDAGSGVAYTLDVYQTPLICGVSTLGAYKYQFSVWRISDATDATST